MLPPLPDSSPGQPRGACHEGLAVVLASRGSTRLLPYRLLCVVVTGSGVVEPHPPSIPAESPCGGGPLRDYHRWYLDGWLWRPRGQLPLRPGVGSDHWLREDVRSSFLVKDGKRGWDSEEAIRSGNDSARGGGRNRLPKGCEALSV